MRHFYRQLLTSMLTSTFLFSPLVNATPIAAQNPSQKGLPAKMAAAPAANKQQAKTATPQQANPAVVNSEDLKDVIRFGVHLETIVNQFVDDYNKANPPYLLDDKAIKGLLDLDNKGTIPAHDTALVQNQILSHSDHLTAEDAVPSDMCSRPGDMPFCHRAEKFAESIWAASSFTNSVARIDNTLTYLFTRYITEPQNRRALLTLMLGFRFYKLNDSYAAKFRHDRMFWYNVAKWGVTSTIAATFMFQFLRHRLVNFKRASKVLDKMAEKFGLAKFFQAEGGPIDPRKLPVPLVYKDGFWIPQPTQAEQYRYGKKVTNSVEWLPSPERRDKIYALLDTPGKNASPEEIAAIQARKDAIATSLRTGKIRALWGDTKTSLKDVLLGDIYSIQPGLPRIKFFASRLGLYSLSAMAIGGTREVLKRERVPGFRDVDATPDTEFKVMAAPIAMQLECSAFQLDTEVSSRNYETSTSDLYVGDVEKLNELVEDYSFVQLAFPSLDRIDLNQTIAELNQSTVLSGHVSLEVTDPYTGMTTYTRNFNDGADPITQSFACPLMRGHRDGEPLFYSKTAVKAALMRASASIESGRDLQNIHMALSRLAQSLEQDPQTAAAAKALENFDFSKDDPANLPPQVLNVLNYYANSLLEIPVDKVFNNAVTQLVARVTPQNAQDGTAALLRVLEAQMKNTTPLRYRPSEILGAASRGQ